MPMLDCDAVMRQLWDYLDGELTAARMAAMRAHLEMCARCQPHVEFERAFLDAVARTRVEHPDPAALSGRVRSALERQGFKVGR